MVKISRVQDGSLAIAQKMSVSFRPNHQGLQVGYNYGLINTEFHLPPGKVTVALHKLMGCPANVQIPERRETPLAPFESIPFSRDPDFVNYRNILN